MTDRSRAPEARPRLDDARLGSLALATITLIGFLLRLHYVSQPMRYDEAVTYLRYASKPLRFSLSSYSTPNNHLLNTLLVHLTVRAFGNHPWAIRLPVLFAGTATIPAAFAAARRLFDREAALLAAAFVAASSWLVEFSTNARGYSFVVLAFLLLVALGADLMERPSRRSWILFSIVTAIGFYALPLMLWPFGVVVGWMFANLTLRKRRRDMLALAFWSCIGLLLTLLAYLPVIATTGLPAMVRTARNLGQQGPHFTAFLRAMLSFAHRDLFAPIAVLLVLGFAAGVLKSRRASFPIPLPIVCVAFAAIAIAADPEHPPARVWLFSVPVYLTTSAYGLVALARMRARISARAIAVVAVAMCVAFSSLTIARGSVLRSNETGSLRDAPRIAAFLRSFMRPDDRVQAFAAAGPTVEYYLDLRHVSPARAGPRYRRSILVVPTLRSPEEEGVPAAELARAHLVRRYPSATVYTVDRAG